LELKRRVRLAARRNVRRYGMLTAAVLTVDFLMLGAGLRRALSDRIADHNDRLARLLDMDLGWELEPAR